MIKAAVRMILTVAMLCPLAQGAQAGSEPEAVAATFQSSCAPWDGAMILVSFQDLQNNDVRLSFWGRGLGKLTSGGSFALRPSDMKADGAVSVQAKGHEGYDDAEGTFTLETYATGKMLVGELTVLEPNTLGRKQTYKIHALWKDVGQQICG